MQSGMSFVLVPLNNVSIIAEIGEAINQLYCKVLLLQTKHILHIKQAGIFVLHKLTRTQST